MQSSTRAPGAGPRLSSPCPAPTPTRHGWAPCPLGYACLPTAFLRRAEPSWEKISGGWKHPWQTQEILGTLDGTHGPRLHPRLAEVQPRSRVNGPCVCDTVYIRVKWSILHGCDVTFNGGQLKCKNTWSFIGTLPYRASQSSGTGAASASLPFKENK